MKRRSNAPHAPAKAATRKGSRPGDAREALRHALLYRLGELRRLASDRTAPLTLAQQRQVYAQMRAVEHTLETLR